MSDWRESYQEGAWIMNPTKRCPNCGATAHFASDFSKFGKHQIRVCSLCGVWRNGKKEGDIMPNKEV